MEKKRSGDKKLRKDKSKKQKPEEKNLDESNKKLFEEFIKNLPKNADEDDEPSEEIIRNSGRRTAPILNQIAVADAGSELEQGLSSVPLPSRAEEQREEIKYTSNFYGSNSNKEYDISKIKYDEPGLAVNGVKTERFDASVNNDFREARGFTVRDERMSNNSGANLGYETITKIDRWKDPSTMSDTERVEFEKKKYEFR